MKNLFALRNGAALKHGIVVAYGHSPVLHVVLDGHVFTNMQRVYARRSSAVRAARHLARHGNFYVYRVVGAGFGGKEVVAPL